MLKSKVFVFVVLILFLLFPFSAFSHTLWINVTNFNPKFYPEYGSSTKIYFGWGHRYPVDDFISTASLNEISLIHPYGKKENITPNEGQFLATKINFKKPGSYIVSTVKKPGFYTMYIDNGKVRHKLGPKTGLKGVITSLYYEQYAKALINVGQEDLTNFDKPVGHKLEIIPLKNPYKLDGSGGHFLPVKVLYDGKPAKYCKIYATYMGFSTRDDFAYSTFTDSMGIAKIRLTHWGPWLIKANMELPASGDLKDKCNKLNYTATLTFEVP
ncbi:MAG TPA: DUF4198 domain-containing protein [Desulfurella acetivorans]|uniref:DUF4198 domain-containing protein n=1 Tax=Desulfurella acetivorans TaxID=33002 RepID=A0A7C6EC04_DESAE|nr:DUF4198 domain-containing protein [Desulfurella acetivorans]